MSNLFSDIISKSNFFRFLLLALFICISIATYPPTSAGSSLEQWQLVLVDTTGVTQNIALPADYTVGETDYTLSDPLLPLSPLANIMGANLSTLPENYPTAIMWQTEKLSWIFLANKPHTICLYNCLYNNETNNSATPADYQAEYCQQFETPCFISGEFYVPLSFLDILDIPYTLNVYDQTVTVRADVTQAGPVTNSNTDFPNNSYILWQSALPLLNQYAISHRHLLTSATATLADTTLCSAQNLLIAAEALHGTVVAPEEFLPPCPDNPTLQSALTQAAAQARLPNRQNTGTFWLQIICRATAHDVTVELYWLDSPSAANEYLAPAGIEPFFDNVTPLPSATT